MVNVEDVDNATVLVDPVDDAVGAAQGAVTASEGPEQWLADPLWVNRKRGIAELQHGGGNGLRKPLDDRSLSLKVVCAVADVGNGCVRSAGCGLVAALRCCTRHQRQLSG